MEPYKKKYSYEAITEEKGVWRHLKNWHRDTPKPPVMPYNTLISNQLMTDEQKLTLLLKILKEYAEMKHCYERDKFYDVYDERELGETVEHAEEYATIHFARTLLEQIGVEFEYPVMKNV